MSAPKEPPSSLLRRLILDIDEFEAEAWAAKRRVLGVIDEMDHYLRNDMTVSPAVLKAWKDSLSVAFPTLR